MLNGRGAVPSRRLLMRSSRDSLQHQFWHIQSTVSHFASAPMQVTMQSVILTRKAVPNVLPAIHKLGDHCLERPVEPLNLSVSLGVVGIWPTSKVSSRTEWSQHPIGQERGKLVTRSHYGLTAKARASQRQVGAQRPQAECGT